MRELIQWPRAQYWDRPWKTHAAADREVVVSKIATTTPGNAAAMRQALMEIVITATKAGATMGYDVACGIIKSKAKHALSTPLRNCDVGTADEQAERFHNFCLNNSSSIDGMCDQKCPCIESPDKCHCLCKWEQIPYEEGGEK